MMDMLRTKQVLIVGAIVTGVSSTVLAGGERIDFPTDYKSSFTQYWEGVRMNSEQYAIAYANDNVFDAMVAGNPLGYGAQIVMEIYALATDDAGNAVPGDFAAVAVMQNMAGWGEAYGEELRNGDWDFGLFTPAGEIRNADATPCLQCHKPLADVSYTFTFEQLAAKVAE